MAGRTVVIGIGNDCRGDDAAGLEAVRLLAAAVPAHVTVALSRGDPAGLVETWTGAGLAVVVDAAASGAPPGTVHRYRETPAEPGPGLPARSPPTGTHSAGLAEAVGLGRVLGRLPRELVVYGIEGADFAVGAAMTPVVARATQRVAALVAGRITSRSPLSLDDPLPPV
ncbi:hydrogenase maturation protease [Planobispora siamensis]|uniref:Peptidase M52 n=1 Tax=Planobispora siamensis TaxID=936338 RepID=A0A8J3WNF1_9ACTN|nr:hydrogenase maturation protease [Planobispora siamensis]GIH95765.1 peptidase M52 [Planobispora siamensis]